MSKAPVQGGRSKAHYRTRNWREYDRGLISRGDLTVWISPELIWHTAEGQESAVDRGSSRTRRSRRY
ncbi:Transposase (plasmid) [Roseomonas mucosa]|uniref:Transposase n=1 Tax=Roseomonas mucosa TaxID=207340 RepID=A0A4Y1MQ81_9PROT|nr:Transposase [Roseomonas mucosa]